MMVICDLEWSDELAGIRRIRRTSSAELVTPIADRELLRGMVSSWSATNRIYGRCTRWGHHCAWRSCLLRPSRRSRPLFRDRR